MQDSEYFKILFLFEHVRHLHIATSYSHHCHLNILSVPHSHFKDEKPEAQRASLVCKANQQGVAFKFRRVILSHRTVLLLSYHMPCGVRSPFPLSPIEA